MFILSGCVSNSDDGLSYLDTDTVSDEIPLKEILEDGFCYDDVYAKYLVSEYKKNKIKEYNQKKIKITKYRSSRIENQALFYAKDILNGKTPNYYASLPLVMNESVDFWVRYFQTVGRSTFTKWLVKSLSIKDVVQEQLRREGLPQDLFFLAMIESGFNNHAFSSKKATGTWQFMSYTAKRYGLKINYWVDERRDPVKSTVAAARYLRDLYIEFEDWYLAMMAYNAGPGKIRRAVRKTHSKDPWDIISSGYVKPETKNYVPKMLAAFLIVSNQKVYGFDVTPKDSDFFPATKVLIKRPVRLEDVATLLGYPLEAIKKWNPEILHGVTPPSDGGKYLLRVRAELEEKLLAEQDTLPKLDIKDVKIHTIKKGDTLIGIAKKYKVGVDSIKKYNPSLHANRLRPGKTVVVPVPSIGVM